MNALKAQLEELLQRVGDAWTPEERSLAQSIAEDYAFLLAKRLEGEDTSAELAHVRAQGASLLAAGTNTLATVLEEEIPKFITGLVSDLVPGL